MTAAYARLVAQSRVLAGVLATATGALAVVGETAVLTHTGGPLGLVLLALAAPVGLTAWVVLGAPTTRSDLDS